MSSSVESTTVLPKRKRATSQTESAINKKTKTTEKSLAVLAPQPTNLQVEIKRFDRGIVSSTYNPNLDSTEEVNDLAFYNAVQLVMKRSLEEYERAKSKIAQLEKDIKRMNGKIQSQMEMEEDFKNQFVSLKTAYRTKKKECMELENENGVLKLRIAMLSNEANHTLNQFVADMQSVFELPDTDDP